MRILVVNDDGIEAPGIRLLTTWASTIGEVTVVSPKGQQSGKSQSISLHNSFEIKKVDYEGAVEAWSVDSTPADCVRFAFDVLGDYELVFSGVNWGWNIGDDIAYSGTCGAMFESAFWNAKGIAFSCSFNSFDSFLPNVGKVWEFFTENNLLEKCPLWNVNFPDRAERIEIREAGRAYVQDHFVKLDGEIWIQKGYMAYDGSFDGTDISAVEKENVISITPMTHDRMERRVFSSLRGLGKDIR
ncbi:MAG: 5'/3'-nucleotidase SurE [Candidatus Ornithospirochaeta sp.]